MAFISLIRYKWPAIFLSLWCFYGLTVYLGSLIATNCKPIVMPWSWFSGLDPAVQAAWAQVYAVILVALVGPFLWWQAQTRKAKYMAPVIVGLLSEIEGWYRSSKSIEWEAVTKGGKVEDMIVRVAKKKLFAVDLLREQLHNIELFGPEFSAAFIECFEAGNLLIREIRYVEDFNDGLEKREIFNKVRDAMLMFGEKAHYARTMLKNK